MKTFLLIGGCGFIGSNLAVELVKNNFNVVIFDRDWKDYPNLNSIKDKIKFVKGDFTVRETLEKCFDENKIDIVVHLVSTLVPGTDFNNVLNDLDINIKGTMQLIDVMKKRKKNRIVYLSSGGTVYGSFANKKNKESDQVKPINYYGWTKLATEEYLHMAQYLFGIEYLIVRPANAYGENQNLDANQGIVAVAMKRLRENKTLEIWGDGNKVRDYVYVSDICNAIISLVNKDKWNNVFNIGSGKGTSINKIVDLINQVGGKKLKFKKVEERKVDVPVNILDINKIYNYSYWKPEVELKDGIKKMWESIS